MLVVTTGKQSNMATVVGRLSRMGVGMATVVGAAVLCRLLEAAQANEDPSSF